MLVIPGNNMFTNNYSHQDSCDVKFTGHYEIRFRLWQSGGTIKLAIEHHFKPQLIVRHSVTPV